MGIFKALMRGTKLGAKNPIMKFVIKAGGKRSKSRRRKK